MQYFDNLNTSYNKTHMDNCIDIVKMLCCILIVGSHCLPLFENDKYNYYYGQWLFRFCVPFFAISTGFLFETMNIEKQKQYIRRILYIYVLSTAIYLPLVIRLNGKVIQNVIFGYHHLWYLSALFLGLIIVYFSNILLKNKKYILIVLLWGGVLLDEYYKILDCPYLNHFVDIINNVGGARHALFFIVPLLLIGSYLGRKRLLYRNRMAHCLLILIFFFLGFVEAFMLKRAIGSSITLDISLFGWLPAIPLFLICLNSPSRISGRLSRKMRKITDIVYIIHIWVLWLVAKYLKIQRFSLFITTLIISYIISLFVYYLLKYIKKHIGV